MDVGSSPSEAAPSPPHRRWIGPVRLIATIALSAWIVAAVDWSVFWTQIRHADLALIALVVLLAPGSPCLSAYKWQQLLVAHGLHYRWSQLARWYFVAGFLSQLLPTGIGGDAYRVYKTLNNGRGTSRAVVSVLLDRATGIAALTLMGTAAAGVLYIRTGNAFAGAFAGLALLGWLALAAAMWLLQRRVGRGWSRHPRWVRGWELFDTLRDELRNHPRQLARALAISFLFHLKRIALLWLCLEAVGVTANYLLLIMASTIVEIAGVLPISIGGLGVAEGSFIFVTAQFGLAAEVALAGMLLLRVLVIPMHLLGAYFYFKDGRPAGQPGSTGQAKPDHLLLSASAKRSAN